MVFLSLFLEFHPSIFIQSQLGNFTYKIGNLLLTKLEKICIFFAFGMGSFTQQCEWPDKNHYVTEQTAGLHKMLYKQLWKKKLMLDVDI